MDSIRQFFSYMNDIDFKYVVLRNWDQLPYDITLGEHSDLDILVYDFDHWCEIFPSAKPEYKLPRVRMKVPIDDSYIYVDVRHLGDDYYPIDFERAILETREYNQRGFWTPDPLHHRIALSYHAVHHKNFIAPEYRKYLGDATAQELLEALKQSGVGWIEPKDKTVGKYNPYWKGATSVVAKDNGWIQKKQISYLGFPLIANEKDILRRLNSRHFPKIKDSEDDVIIIEDCGEQVTVSNLPSDWEIQLSEIQEELKSAHIEHRDIKLDNLMVKDGVLKLIDFGWAVTIPNYRGEPFNKIEQEPPSCLGWPNKPSSGFSDAHSIRCVRKQIEYMLEEVTA